MTATGLGTRLAGRVERLWTGEIRPRRVLEAAGFWVGLAVLGVANGVLREVLVTPVVGSYWGHIASTVTLVAALSAVAWAYFRWRPAHTGRELVAIGVTWLGLTVLFEFGFGHYLMGHPWSRLLADYDLLAGRVWVLVLLTMLLAPMLLGRSRSEHAP